MSVRLSRASVACWCVIALTWTINASAGAAWSPQQRPETRPRTAPPEQRTQPRRNLADALDAQMAEAEAALRDDEMQVAESRYRDAIMQGWMILGALELADGRMPEARDAFQRATGSAVDARLAERSLAIASLETGQAAEAVNLLTRLVAQSPRDPGLRRLLAQALVANGQAGQAVQELEEARTAIPDDLELAFMLASGYLRQQNPEKAARIFDQIAAARPLPETDVLIGRTYRDFGEYTRARTVLERALQKKPGVRRAHYYLGTIAIMEEGFARLEEATREFQRELAAAPTDPVTNLRLGIVLEEARRHDEALPALEIAARDPMGGSEAYEYLGRCQLALGRNEAGVASLRRALALSSGTPGAASRIGRIHYQLGAALRTLGREQEAATHFAEAERLATARTETTREALARFLTDVPEPGAPGDIQPLLSALRSSPFADAPEAERQATRKRVGDALARAYMNLGVVQARANRFAHAATFFEGAVAASPDFPLARYSLGVAYFSAQEYEKAATSLERAFASDPANSDARRMLAIASLNSERYDRAAALLANDPGRDTDPSLQYAYGLALVRGGRADEAQREFSKLLADHGELPELNVVLGQAYAQQGNNEAAIEALQRALRARPDVAEANTALGIIYMKQGKLDEAEAALRAELASHAADVRARHTLAAVLDMQNRPSEAIAELRAVLRTKPAMADARYLLGKILLAQGDAHAATSELEAGVRLAPDDANIHFQLAQAYEKTGREELARQQFEIYRQLKDKKREAVR